MWSSCGPPVTCPLSGNTFSPNVMLFVKVQRMRRNADKREGECIDKNVSINRMFSQVIPKA